MKTLKSKEFYMSKELLEALRRQHYAVFGHSAVKLCHYTKASIKQEKVCYKEKFYGIKCHRCLQMSPAVVFCNQQCIYCWRPIARVDIKKLNEAYWPPNEIVKKAIEEQKQLLSGLGGIKERIDLKKFEEAQKPKHAAISLSGEPTLYPKIGELIGEFFKAKFSTVFLVTNGTLPQRLLNLEVMPTQLYLSLEAIDEKMHIKINRPIVQNTWKNINESLNVLKSLNKKTRTCIRITAIKNWNMENTAKEFASLIANAEPDFVEVKGYSWVGFSRHRLQEENMPSMKEVESFAKEINEFLNYKISDKHIDARVVLLEKGEKERKINF